MLASESCIYLQYIGLVELDGWLVPNLRDTQGKVFRCSKEHEMRILQEGGKSKTDDSRGTL